MAESTTNDKPVILIVPGSFSNASSYYALVDKIQSLGSEASVHNLPSTNRHAPEEPASLQDDAVFFRNIIEKLADQGKDIVVVMHSYGGVVGSEAVKGVAKAERQKSGKLGGAIKLVYVTAVVLPVGVSMTSEQGDPPAGLVEMGKVRRTLLSPLGAQLYMNIVHTWIGLHTILTSFLEFDGTGRVHADCWRGASRPSSLFGYRIH
jgi:hypothetical protein